MVLLRHISIALTAAVAALGSALFIAWNYFYRRRVWSPEVDYYMIKEVEVLNPATCELTFGCAGEVDSVWEVECFSAPYDQDEEEDRTEKQVLVLGLDGAGKSSMLQGLNGAGTKRECRPTRGFNFMSVRTPACQLDFLEIGGGEDLRVYWADYLRKTHILVYVVDSSDQRRLPLAKDELHRLLRVDTQLPVVVLGNKQDKPNAISISELHDALSLSSVRDKRKVFLMAAQLGSNGLSGCSSLQALRDLLLRLV